MAKHKSRKPGHRATPVLQKASASGLDEAAPPDVQTPLEDNHAADGLQLVQDITQAVLDGTFTLPVHGPSSDSSADSSTPTQSATRTDPTQEEDFLPIRETVPEAPVPEAAAPEAAAPEAAAPEAAAPEADGSESEDVEAKAQSGEGETGSGDVAVSPDDLDDEVFKSAQAPADSSVPTVGNVPGFLDRGAPEVVSEEGSAAPVLGEGGRADTSVVEQKGSLGMVPRMVQEFDLEKWDKEKRAFEDRISQLLIADGQARMDISNLEAQLAAIKSESEQTAKESKLREKRRH
ncbi:hypothetical protein GNI_129550 [Gregarina niphandrodes]|uniref:Uncharacterized protein n=1 Tax=Gregarina niphandrodes TaxID=110365 RepID=A0A023B232_GRENI|nr:hypothetical protein GNI_129550 [Gregarina niphandrodes]EZG48217.1 hypothetical protein GNI_129550 [Gregarina niphandrodes]|eukprot:XP_011132113.1 hypothetical protein GNI_129550 [Gregarina niphandrodes]